METSNKNYAQYIRQAFGNAYRISDRNWRKLRSGTFYNPWHHRAKVNPAKVLMFHAKDDPFVPYDRSQQFAEVTGVTLKTLQRGGHISTDYVTRKFWPHIRKFFASAGA
jgi:predicted alpha/beta hydrolase family esterase